MFSSVRARLTLWYLAMLSIVLIAFSVGVYMLLARSLYERLDSRLGSTLEAATDALKPVTGQAADIPAITRALEGLRFPNQTIAVLDTSGRVLAERVAPGGPPLRLPPAPFSPSESLRFYELPETQPDADDSCRGVFRGVPAASYAVVVMQSLEPVGEQLDSLLDVLYIVVPLSLMLAGLGRMVFGAQELGASGSDVGTRPTHQR